MLNSLFKSLLVTLAFFQSILWAQASRQQLLPVEKYFLKSKQPNMFAVCHNKRT